MPRYFFIVGFGEQEIDDPEGVALSGDAAAIEYARKIIDDLRNDRRLEDTPNPVIAVKNAEGDVIYRFPGN
jgi:hypothetical protein